MWLLDGLEQRLRDTFSGCVAVASVNGAGAIDTYLVIKTGAALGHIIETPECAIAEVSPAINHVSPQRLSFAWLDSFNTTFFQKVVAVGMLKTLSWKPAEIQGASGKNLTICEV